MLRSVGYDAAARRLELEFVAGPIYAYLGVPARRYDELMAADSHGKYFNAWIKDVYRTVQLS